MDEYPAFSLDHNVPLLFTLGISSGAAYEPEPELEPELKEQAVLIRSDLARVESAQGDALLRYVRERDASALPFHGSEARRYRFRVRTAERRLLLPPRRATLPENFEVPSGSVALHSPFSPLSPASHLYPDGLIDSQWLRKHQELVPSVLLCFYSLTSDPSLATLQDNKIKTDIINIRGLLGQSGYRTRLAVALLVDQDAPLSVDGTHERADYIRRGCGLDPKALFLVAPLRQHQQKQHEHDEDEDEDEDGDDDEKEEEEEQVARVAENMLATLYGFAIEYYRDLGRHARKKRGRGYAPQPTVPPTTGTSQTLSLAGWNVRYDFKSAVLAECRLETDAALRAYEQVYENLLGPELLEAIPSWSPRWNEARLLADVVAIRHLRCLLWTGQHTTAVRRWQAHRDRITDLVDRRGRGTRNYGWAAWEARWATVMAQLIERTEVPELTATRAPTDTLPPVLFLPPEKTVLGERLQPWELLHHPGYWHRLATRHLSARRAFALAMPEDDRRPPSFSPASRVASKAFTYDTYMCPDPHEELPLPGTGEGVNHTRLVVESLGRARAEFLKRRQLRLAAEISLECARELATTSTADAADAADVPDVPDVPDWPGIVELLRPLWEQAYFQAEGWLDIAEELAWRLRAAAAEMAMADLLLAIDWELMDRSFTRRQHWHYDITRSLEGISIAPASKPIIRIDDGTMLSFLSPTFVFKSEEGKAGQSTQAQLSIVSNAHLDSAPIMLNRLRIVFEGSMRTIELRHQASETGTRQRKILSGVVFSPVSWEEEVPVPDADVVDASHHSDNVEEALHGTADLTLLPGHTTVFNMDIPLREPGEVVAASLHLHLRSDTFDLEHTSIFREGVGASVWFISPTSRKTVARVNALVTRILPRPPKMQIKGVVLADQYYTDESIALEFDVYNAEDADANARIDVILFGEAPPPFDLLFSEGRGETSLTTEDDGESKLLSVPLGTVERARSVKIRLLVKPINRPSRYDLTLRVAYHLATDPQTPITQTAVFFLNVANPFEANYDLLPRLNPDPWPSYFDPDGVRDPAQAPDTDDGDDGNDDGNDDGMTDIPARGLAQTWCLVTRYASFAAEDLRVVGLDVRVTASPAVRCTAVARLGVPPAGDAGRVVSPKTISEAAFDLVARKRSLDDRGPVTLDVSFVIRWARLRGGDDAGQQEDKEAVIVNTTTLPVPRFNIFGTEPRVLASVSYVAPGSAGSDRGSERPPSRDPPILVLDVVIENASAHFLTFGVAMEPSTAYAFSGPKQTTLNVLPVSRRRVTYRLLPLPVGTGEDKDNGDGTWIRPALTVRDKYFQKVLRVIPAEGMRMDKDGFSVWVPPPLPPDGGAATKRGSG